MNFTACRLIPRLPSREPLNPLALAGVVWELLGLEVGRDVLGAPVEVGGGSGGPALPAPGNTAATREGARGPRDLRNSSYWAGAGAILVARGRCFCRLRGFLSGRLRSFVCLQR
jgi:hypothetical protein